MVSSQHYGPFLGYCTLSIQGRLIIVTPKGTMIERGDHVGFL